MEPPRTLDEPGRPRANRVRDRLCALVAERIADDPRLLEPARRHLDSDRYRSGYADQWRAILDAGPLVAIAVLTSNSPHVDPLKSDNPFSTLGLVDEDTRLAIIEEIYGRRG